MEVDSGVGLRQLQPGTLKLYTLWGKSMVISYSVGLLRQGHQPQTLNPKPSYGSQRNPYLTCEFWRARHEFPIWGFSRHYRLTYRYCERSMGGPFAGSHRGYSGKLISGLQLNVAHSNRVCGLEYSMGFLF